jgi:CO/xanthine dehydrogenase FAD-binding subunit
MSLEILTPSNLNEVAELLDTHREDSRILAGGTDILLHLQSGKRRAKCLININELPLNYIRVKNEALCIGANTKAVEIEHHPFMQQHSRFFECLLRACNLVGSPQIRNMASVGGNVMNASPAADLIPPLMALDAKLVAMSVLGERIIPIGGFFAGPGRTVLTPNEFLVEIQIPVGDIDQSSLIAGFHKLGGGGRERHVISIVCLAGRAKWNGALGAIDQLEDIKLAIGAVAPTPLRLHRTEALLTGQVLTLGLIEEACQVLIDEIHPIDDIRGSVEYKRLLSQSFLREFLYRVMDEQKS